MSDTRSVRLASPAPEMAQEEILKAVSYLSRDIRGARFKEGGLILEFEAPAEATAELLPKVEALAVRIQRGLRSLQRQVVHKTASVDRPVFRGPGAMAGVHYLGAGIVALEGLPLRLFRYFDRVFEEFGRPWHAEPLLTPTLIEAGVLAKCDYFRSFPHSVTFAAHLPEDTERIDDFRRRHQERDTLDDGVTRDFASPPEACLSPAVCYHAYRINAGRKVPAAGLAYGMCGKCFRYETSNMKDLRRLWDFTMREVVFLGDREDVLARREKATKMMSDFLDAHELAAEIRTASDPFFIAPDAVSKTYFQLSSETKYEVSLLLPDDERLATGSLNYHTDFFGRAFDVGVEGSGPMYSVCVAFGLERWVYAFLAQHGDDPSHWPAPLRKAPEFTEA
jgi:seryl-tRNA synthetase